MEDDAIAILTTVLEDVVVVVIAVAAAAAVSPTAVAAPPPPPWPWRLPHIEPSGEREMRAEQRRRQRARQAITTKEERNKATHKIRWSPSHCPLSALHHLTPPPTPKRTNGDAASDK